VQRRIFGHKKEEVTGEWRKLFIEKHYNLHYSINTVRVIKLRKIDGHGM
jgi:hypothetical protein